MTIQIIFEGDVKDSCKDILFFTADTGLDIQVVYFAMDSLLVPSCAYMLAVCH